MVEIIPHINTLIVDIGTELTKVGYTGDFHPKYCFRTAEFIASKPTLSQDTTCKILEKYVKESLIDSLIIVENPDSELVDASKILRFLFVNKLCLSVMFLKSPICDVFGFGKISGTVLSCSASTFRTSAVLNGKIVETYAKHGGSRLLENTINELVIPVVRDNLPEFETILQMKPQFDVSKLFYRILESPEAITKLKSEYHIDIQSLIFEGISEFIDKIPVLRSTYHINKKNSANGCIILSGGLFRFDTFYCLVKALVIDRIGADFSDFILRDKELNCTFAGASVFGANTQSKTMFITSYDWQNVGCDILKFKSIN